MSKEIHCLVKGGVFHPYKRHAKLMAREYPDGSKVVMEVKDQRSGESHRQQFAWLDRCFATIPEIYHDQPWAESPMHLRKHALIKTGYCDVDTINVGAGVDVQAVAAMVGNLARKAEGYAVIEVFDTIVICRTAKSQSMRSMNKREFQDSKQKIMEFVASVLEVDIQEIIDMEGSPF